MVPKRISFVVLSGVAVGVTFVVTWMAWKFVKKKYFHTRPLYVAKKIIIVNSPEQWEASYLQLKKDMSKIKILGLDCEWVQKHKVALLQLASPSGLCVLVQLFKLQPSFPESLHLLLADSSILKVGVAVVDDGKRLHQDYGLIVRGCVDLRHVFRRAGKSFHCPSKGLRGLANGILGIDINKSISVRCGNWEAEVYSQQQMEYAATDAAVAVDIFLSLVFAKLGSLASSTQAFKNRRLSSANVEYNTPTLPIVVHENQPSLNNQAALLSETRETSTTEQLMFSDEAIFQRSGTCSDVGARDSQENENTPADVSDKIEEITNSDVLPIHDNVKLEHHHTRNITYDDSTIFPTQMMNVLQDDEKEEIYKFARSLCQGMVDCGSFYQSTGSGSRPLSKQVEKTKNNSYSFRKRPLWDNCRLQAPDGGLLCTCDLKKALWYLDKELADTVCEDPLTVRLRFEPANRPESERNYYLQEKKNICVVCGCERDYVRKFVVPFEYRKFFPSSLKDHSSHDVLLLCIPCHRKSCDSDAVLRIQLAEECNAPLDSGAASRTFMDHELQKVRSAGRALMMKKDSIPEKRVVDLKKLLQDFYGVDNVTEELIKQAAAIDAKQTVDSYISHAEKVVRHMASCGGLMEFQRRWRQHFIDTMNPQYLPAFWSVDFVPEAWTQGHLV